MSLDMLNTNFSGLSSGDFILRIGTIADRLEVHPAFPEFPEHVPGPERLRELTAQYKKAVDEAANGDRQKVAEKKALRLEMEQAQMITLIRPQSVNKQNGAVTILNRFFSMNLFTVSRFRLYF